MVINHLLNGMVLQVQGMHSPRKPLPRFTRKYYTVYDRERLRIGFALARHGEKSPMF